MKHIKLFEEFESSVINIIIDGEDYTFTLLSDKGKVYLMKDDEIYQRLDIDIPDSENLNDDEFFMSPDVKKEIINELLEQGFIQETDKTSIAGDKKVKAYIL